ncbi:sodium-bile acid cotransporter [Holotrichia oblita]|uniref:Sodium-bile acid cotransporter n=1 Tax=Holotrichia oblita TaxID=644536 RepID=A0ACB9T132_HOLOL|nr:sodium-bile acid cotransporter [Holotrichia oblita]
MLALCRYVYSQVDSSKWNITCDPTNPTLYVDETIGVHCNVTGTQHGNIYFMQIQSEDIGILNADDQVLLITNSYDDFSTSRFNMTGNFLGKTAITMKIKTISEVKYEETMPVTVIRRKRAIDHIFTASVATLVALIYINFGCALNWNEVRAGVRRPIGPVIGFISQFLFMPLLSFGLGKILFPNNTDMQLGMFFAGVAPAGGASNMWTVILGGNLSLSITMTTISNIAAFAMMPLWLFTLGKQIFDKSDIPVPYMQITTYALALLIVVSGLGLPWLGYVLAWIFAKICRQNSKDSLTIAIEAGIQNTGISIFLLRVVLPQPEADLTTVAPVAVATMTPIPLFLLYICQKIRER